MPEFLRIMSMFKEHTDGELRRSDVLRVLVWPIAGILAAFTVALTIRAPEWVLICLFVCLALFLLLYAGGFAFFAKTDSDALRSESYKLRKLAIEQGLFGDSETGLMPRGGPETADPSLLIEGKASAISKIEFGDGA